jgi:hypothetical protein
MTGTRTEHYEWLLPIGTRAQAHAFVLGAKSSICLVGKKFGVGVRNWEHEQAANGEPRRARCHRCVNILRSNPEMVEEQGP